MVGEAKGLFNVFSSSDGNCFLPLFDVPPLVPYQVAVGVLWMELFVIQIRVVAQGGSDSPSNAVVVTEVNAWRARNGCSPDGVAVIG